MIISLIEYQGQDHPQIAGHQQEDKKRTGELEFLLLQSSAICP